MIGIILDHIWQSTAFLLLTGILTLFFGNNGAHVRHALWTAASVKFLMPLLLFTWLGGFVAALFAQPIPAPEMMQALHSATVPFTGPSTIAITAPDAGLNWPLILFWVWAVGLVTIIAIWLRRWFTLAATLRAAVPIEMTAPMPVKLSQSNLEPGLVGFITPTLLLPRGIIERLSNAELQSIIAHEVCHLRRRDNLLALLHMLVEALFWFWPPVWWLGAQLVKERERACDEAVIAQGNEPDIYAESILKVCKLYVHSTITCASGISGADLRRRVEEIMSISIISRLSTSKKVFLAAAAAFTIALPVSFGAIDLSPALAQSTAPYPGTEAAVRHQMEILASTGKPDYSQLGPELAAAAHAQGGATFANFKKWGAFKSVIFRGKDGGADVYEAIFANQRVACVIYPLLEGKIAGMLFGPMVDGSGAGAVNVSREFLRKIIDGALVNTVPYDGMSTALAAVMQKQFPGMQITLKSLGALHKITFTGTTPEGWDGFTSVHDNGSATWQIAPMPGGKVSGIILAGASLPGGKQHPGTEASLRRYILSLQRGAPDYDEMTPQKAAGMRAQISPILARAKTWGALKSITFEGAGLMDMDDYHAVFEHGQVEWYVGPLTADGKVQRLQFYSL